MSASAPVGRDGSEGGGTLSARDGGAGAEVEKSAGTQPGGSLG